MYHLPKPYLSYSALDLWLKNKNAFRRRYYEGIQDYGSPEMRFGKHIATLLENADESVSHIKQYSHPEYKLQVTIDDVPVFGFIDSFDPETKSILEFKTGKTAWTQQRVNDHKQLDLYSLAVEILLGEVNDIVELVWMQTEQVAIPQSGLVAHEDAYGIRLTGKVEVFPRTVTPDDRQAMRTLLTTTAQEISDDYTAWKKAT